MADRPVKGDSNSGRSIVYATEGMIATSQPLASAAGLKVLMQGGNAVDAAIAANAVLCVVEPFMCGIGGDLFALIWSNSKNELIGFNGSGRSGRLVNRERLVSEGNKEMPGRGVHTVTVPGAVDAWCRLLDDYGTMGLDTLLGPAIDYAERGFPVSEIIASQWKEALTSLSDCTTALDVYTLKGRAPEPGEVMLNLALAEDLKLIAAKGRTAFYEGLLAEKICHYLNKRGSGITIEDFIDHAGEYVIPITTNYRGYDVYELPPNGQGAVVLEMLNILEGFDLAKLGHNTSEYIHLLIEAKKYSYKDRTRYIADPAFNDLPIEKLISKEYASQVRNLIDPAKASKLYGGDLRSSDTVYLSVVDKSGNCVSLINSIYGLFGAGLVPYGTGILMQNRGSLFSLKPDNFNCLEPQKRPLHTIIPAMVLQDNSPCFCFGVMGGDMQPQGHVQIILNMIDFGFNIQKAGEADRVCHTEEGVALESGINWQSRIGLLEKGHRIISELNVFGGYQGIYIDQETGVLAGASDPRKDGCALGL